MNMLRQCSCCMCKRVSEAQQHEHALRLVEPQLVSASTRDFSSWPALVRSWATTCSPSCTSAFRASCCSSAALAFCSATSRRRQACSSRASCAPHTSQITLVLSAKAMHHMRHHGSQRVSASVLVLVACHQTATVCSAIE